MYLGTSSEFNTAIRKDGRTFRARLTCGEECIESGFTSIGIYGGSNNADTITIGSTISQRIEVEMQETDIALSGKEWLLEIGLLTGGIIPSDNLYPSDELLPGMYFYEYVPVGYFTPEKPSTDNGKTTFKAYDRMIKLSVMYTCLLDTVTTLTVLNDISQITGVPIDISELEEIPIPKPVGYTCREVLMYIAQLYGKFANVSRNGVIEFHWWTQVDDYTITADDTNGFKHDEMAYVLGYIYMANAEGDDAISFTAGDGKQGISVYNPFITEGIVENIYADIGGFTYTASNVSFMKADIRLDPWDMVLVTDNKGNEYKVPIMSVEFKYDGGLSATFSAVGHTETQEEIDFKGPMKLLQERMESKVVDTARKLQSQITQNAESISAEVKRAIDSEVEMAAAIKVNAEGIKQKVSKGELSSEISQEAGLISIKGNRIAIESDYFKLSEDGSIEAKNGSFTGTFEQYDSSGQKSIEIKNNQVKVYAWNDDGNYVGSLGALHNSDDDTVGISVWSEYGDFVSLGYENPNDNTKIKYAIKIIPEEIETGGTPRIVNTGRGTLFPDNPGGGIVVENGFIKSWSMSGTTANLFSGHSGGGVTIKNGLICGWDLDSVSGKIFSHHPVGIEVKNGLITDWDLDGANGTIFSDNPSGGITVKDGLITGWSMSGTTANLFSGHSGGGVNIKNGLICGWDLDSTSGTFSAITGIGWSYNDSQVTKITSITRLYVVVKNGLICDWYTEKTEY